MENKYGFLVNKRINKKIDQYDEVEVIKDELDKLINLARIGIYFVELPDLDEYNSEEADLSLLQYCYYRFIYDIANNIKNKLNDINDLNANNNAMRNLIERFRALSSGCILGRVSKACVISLCESVIEPEFSGYCKSADIFNPHWSIGNIADFIIFNSGGSEDLLKVVIEDRDKFILINSKSVMGVNNCIIDTIVVLLKGYKKLCATQNVNAQHISSLEYILGQTIRAYKVPDEKTFISEAAKDRWESLTSDDINKYDYNQKFTCDKLKKSTDFLLFTGSQNKGTLTTINPGDKICFNDMFHVDHIVPVQLIKEELHGLSMSQITAQKVGRILQKMCLCRILKEEDRKIGRTAGRTLDCKQTICNVYNPNGVFVVGLPSKCSNSTFLNIVYVDATFKAYLKVCACLPFVWEVIGSLINNTLPLICNKKKDYVCNLLCTIPIYLRNHQPDPMSKEDIVERLGAYFPNRKENSPYIEIYVDTILNSVDEDKFEWLFTKVLIHELAHAVLDINNYECYGNVTPKVLYSTEFGRWREESMANAVALRVISDYGDQYFYDYSEYFMLHHQPAEYALGVKMADWDYSDFCSVIDGKINGVDQALQDDWLDYVKNGNPTWEGLHRWNGRLSK